MLVAFTELEVSKTGTSALLAKRMYMGFGYNPDLIRNGERLDMLDFFAWMKRLQSLGVEEWVIWDASAYSIVNRGRVGRMRGIEEIKDVSARTARILEILVEEQDLPRRREMRDNWNLRRIYLQRLIEVTGIRGQYMDAREVFRGGVNEFSESLAVALEKARELAEQQPGLAQQILPKQQNAMNILYLPLEMAEALYLSLLCRVDGKFGPRTEKFFDAAILNAFADKCISYTTLRSPTPEGIKPGYLGDTCGITVSVPERTIMSVVNDESSTYGRYVRGYLFAFRRGGESFADCAIRMRNLLRGDRP